ncbi:hypothetical protein BGX38DRAFT_892977 [Terfezia claveryi]|nr:hypothetical protein BGX38DRAFT_892977 [Terfezia claveryi]
MCCICLGTITSQFCSKNKTLLHKLWQKVLNEGPGGRNKNDDNDDHPHDDNADHPHDDDDDHLHDGNNNPDEYTSEEEEEDPDNETGDDDNMNKAKACILTKFPKKLAGYMHACITITRCLLFLHWKLGKPLTTTIIPVRLMPPVDAKTLVVFDTFEEFKKAHLKTVLPSTENCDFLSSIFTKNERVPVYVHAEMKLAFFYLTHPEIMPNAGIIGVNKSSCFLCDAFFKYVQQQQANNPMFSVSTTGYRISLFLKTCHKRVYSNWLFPILEAEDTSLSGEGYKMCQERLRLVALNIQETLKEKCEELLTKYCKFEDEEEESSGHEGDSVDFIISRLAEILEEKIKNNRHKRERG